jgi:hypothetical protein
MLDPRGQLRAALGFSTLPLPSYDRALWALRTWLDSWTGIGHVAVEMHRQGFDLQLTQYDERGWRATFYTTGMEHSPTSATGKFNWGADQHQPRHARDAAHAMERGGVVAGSARVQESALAAERDPARGVVNYLTQRS